MQPILDHTFYLLQYFRIILLVLFVDLIYFFVAVVVSAVTVVFVDHIVVFAIKKIVRIRVVL